jgi:hypothetical protein
MHRCTNCQKELRLDAPPGRQDVCPYCQADLHCCFNCRFYSPTASQQCLNPGLEPVKSKHKANFCEEFRFREFHAQTSLNLEEKTKKTLDDLFRKL